MTGRRCLMAPTPVLLLETIMEFLVHNVAHHPKTRHIRAQAPVHPRHKQFILKTQRRLIPNRPIEVSEEELHENLEDLRKLEAQGIVEVRTKSGELLLLKDFSVQEKLPDPPKPKFEPLTLQNAPPRGKSRAFTPDNTEQISVQPEEHAGGGMTEEAVAQANEDALLPPLPPELMHLENEVSVSAQPSFQPAEEEPDGTSEEEPEVEHRESAPKTKSRPRRR